MKEKILIVKKRDEKMKFKVTDKVNRGYTSTDYNTSIQITDYKQLATMLTDLKFLFNAPVEKAFKEMKKKKSPFW